MSRDWLTEDGVTFANWRMEGSQLIREVRQPSRRPILAALAEVRKNPQALRPLTFMGWELRIPLNDYWPLLQKFPDLHSSDAETKTKAWRSFMASSESDPYRVRDRDKSRSNA